MHPSKETIDSSLLYDELDGNLYWKTERANGKVKPGDLASKISSNGYSRVYLEGKYYKAHHIVWCIKKGYWPTQIDHIDGVRSHNRIDNLREIDPLMNAANRGLNSNNKLGVRGVHETREGRFRACIVYKGIKYDLGIFADLDTAKEAYDSKSKELRKEYHRDI